jgi:hypothetical protein
LYHYFVNKGVIVAEMTNAYLSSYHGYFRGIPAEKGIGAILLSELWDMKGWDEVEHSRTLFELLAEAGRNENIPTIWMRNTDLMFEIFIAQKVNLPL